MSASAETWQALGLVVARGHAKGMGGAMGFSKARLLKFERQVGDSGRGFASCFLAQCRLPPGQDGICRTLGRSGTASRRRPASTSHARDLVVTTPEIGAGFVVDGPVRIMKWWYREKQTLECTAHLGEIRHLRALKNPPALRPGTARAQKVGKAGAEEGGEEETKRHKKGKPDKNGMHEDTIIITKMTQEAGGEKH